MPWTDRNLLAVDTETTGIDPWTDRIVEIGVAIINPDGDVTATWSQIINPGIDIPDGAAAVHGITTDRAQTEGVTPQSALLTFASILNAHRDAVVCAFNASYDWPLIVTEADRHSVEIPPAVPIVDPFVIDKHVDRYRKGSRKLVDVATAYGVEFTGQAHGALADAIAAGQTMQAICQDHPQIHDRSLAGLFLDQMRWASDQRASFEAYKRRSDPTFTCSKSWPFPIN